METVLETMMRFVPTDGSVPLPPFWATNRARAVVLLKAIENELAYDDLITTARSKDVRLSQRARVRASRMDPRDRCLFDPRGPAPPAHLRV